MCFFPGGHLRVPENYRLQTGARHRHHVDGGQGHTQGDHGGVPGGNHPGPQALARHLGQRARQRLRSETCLSG